MSAPYEMNEIAAERRRRSEALAERTGAKLLDLLVSGSVDLSPSMRRLQLFGEALRELSYEPGQDVMLAVALNGEHVVRRRYTIRNLDRRACVLEIDIVTHGEGPGARFAQGATPGTRIEVIGPRGKIGLREEADWHLFVGDDAFIPAASVMASAARGQATCLLEVGDEHDELDLGPLNSQVSWHHRDGVAPGRSEVLKEALSSLELPPGDGHVYLGGEHRLVNVLRDLLLEKGLSPAQMSPKAYWRIGSANADHGEPPRD